MVLPTSCAGGSVCAAHRNCRTTVVGFRMTCDAHVRGPLALGGLSHFCLGLFEPAR